MLKWGTPLDRQLTSDAFDVRDLETHERLPYVGMMVKRGTPTTDDFVEIAAGESVAVTVDLRQSYEMRTGRSYYVRLDARVMVWSGSLVRDRAAALSSRNEWHKLGSNTVSFSL